MVLENTLTNGGNDPGFERVERKGLANITGLRKGSDDGRRVRTVLLIGFEIPATLVIDVGNTDKYGSSGVA
jgi:hypothetical protein